MKRNLPKFAVALGILILAIGHSEEASAAKKRRIPPSFPARAESNVKRTVPFDVAVALMSNMDNRDAFSFSSVSWTTREALPYFIRQSRRMIDLRWLASNQYDYFSDNDGFLRKMFDVKISIYQLNNQAFLDTLPETVRNIRVSEISPHFRTSITTQLNKLSAVQSMDLSFGSFIDVSPISTLVNLTNLDLSVNQLSDMTPLAPLTKLIRLKFWHNKLIDLSPIAALTNLKDLCLEMNRINDILPLAALTNLTHLDLSHNQITDISPLAGLTNLTILSLNNNRITDYSPLMKLTQLKKLTISRDQVSPEQIEALRAALPETNLNLY